MCSGRLFPFVWILVWATLAGCQDLEDPKSQAATAAPTPEQEAWGWSTAVTRNGVRRAFVVSEHLIKVRANETVTLDSGVTVFFYDAEGQDTASVLSSDAASIEDSKRRLVALGHVRLVSRDSTHLHTDTLVWNRETDLISGEGRVTIRRPDGEETGVGFEATSDLKRWTLNKVTTRLIRPDASD